MNTLDLTEMTARVRKLLEGSALGEVVQDVSIEPVSYEDDEVLRVTIRVRKPDKVKADDAIAIIRQINDELSEVDERFASVRFAEAA
ncbi:MAG TPA: hypothetical protein VF605_07410 [Allosphingosinicella sp.]|jgi:hypothetical protein